MRESSEGEFDEELRSEIIKREEAITAALERADEKDAIHGIFELSDIGNKAFQEGEPWKARKDDPEKAGKLLRTLMYLIRDLGVMVIPYMPETGKKILSFVSSEGSQWDSVGSFAGSVAVGETELLFQKLEDDRIKELRERYSGSQKEREERRNKEEEVAEVENEEKKETLAEEFARRVILKVSKIVNVEKHPGGDKLYILKLDCGEEEPRQIVSSIVPFYTIDELMNRNIVLVSNLKPANFRGVKSYGMLLAASDKNDETHATCELIFCDDIAPGTVLKYEGEGDDTEKVTTYIKPDHFFALPMKTIDGYVTIDGKKLGSDGHFLRVFKYVDGNVG